MYIFAELRLTDILEVTEFCSRIYVYLEADFLNKAVISQNNEIIQFVRTRHTGCFDTLAPAPTPTHRKTQNLYPKPKLIG